MYIVYMPRVAWTQLTAQHPDLKTPPAQDFVQRWNMEREVAMVLLVAAAAATLSLVGRQGGEDD